MGVIEWFFDYFKWFLDFLIGCSGASFIFPPKKYQITGDSDKPTLLILPGKRNLSLFFQFYFIQFLHLLNFVPRITYKIN